MTKYPSLLAKQFSHTCGTAELIWFTARQCKFSRYAPRPRVTSPGEVLWCYVTLPTPKDIGVNTLNFKPNFKCSPLNFWGNVTRNTTHLCGGGRKMDVVPFHRNWRENETTWQWKPKRTAVSSRGFLAAARLSCISECSTGFRRKRYPCDMT